MYLFRFAKGNLMNSKTNNIMLVIRPLYRKVYYSPSQNLVHKAKITATTKMFHGWAFKKKSWCNTQWFRFKELILNSTLQKLKH